jgi:hypothetical protein
VVGHGPVHGHSPVRDGPDRAVHFKYLYLTIFQHLDTEIMFIELNTTVYL